jgi:hypothetical protein
MDDNLFVKSFPFELSWYFVGGGSVSNSDIERHDFRVEDVLDLFVLLTACGSLSFSSMLFKSLLE